MISLLRRCTIAYGILVFCMIQTVLCEDDGRENSDCDVHQRECMPVEPLGVVQHVLPTVKQQHLQDLMFCLNRCVHPVDLRAVHGPRMARLNWDLTEAKLREENEGVAVGLDELRENERVARLAHAQESKQKQNNGKALGHNKSSKSRARRQASGHDDQCLAKQIGMSFDEAVEQCQSAQGAQTLLRRNKRGALHDRAVNSELKNLFMLKYTDEIIAHFCPQSEVVMQWCLDKAMQGEPPMMKYVNADDLHQFYCDRHQRCTQLAKDCVAERSSDLVQMCECFDRLYDVAQNSRCRGAAQLVQAMPGQCGSEFMANVAAYSASDHEVCASGSRAITPDQLIKLIDPRSS